jgi:hypothetical protein
MQRRMMMGVSVAILLAVVQAASAANLIANSEFDTDLSGWSMQTGVSEWSPEDCCGSPTSGSASLPLIDTASATLVSDCVDVTPGAAYDLVLFAETRPIPPGFLGGHGVASVAWVRNGQSCIEALPASGQPQIDIPAEDDGWRSFGMTVTAPADAIAARVTLFGELAGLSVAVNLHFDHALFGPTGSVPVTLQSFYVE